jgi:2-phospho-L-lactate guanylyltransferase
MNEHLSQSPQPRRHGTEPWRLVVPVKQVGAGKTRLMASLAAAGWRVDREALGRAIAQDTLEAAASAVGADQLVLVTSDPVLGEAWRQRGAQVQADPGHGLNATIRSGLDVLDGFARVGVMLGDLPALRGADLTAALRLAAGHEQTFVPDTEGVGTVLRCSAQGAARLVPLFGLGSAARHESAGATRLEVDLPSLRTDVDDLAALLAARDLGLGHATTAALATLVIDAVDGVPTHGPTHVATPVPRHVPIDAPGV